MPNHSSVSKRSDLYFVLSGSFKIQHSALLDPGFSLIPDLEDGVVTD